MACNCGRGKRITGFGHTPSVTVNTKQTATPHTLHLADGTKENYASSIEAHAARLSGKGGTVRPTNE